MTATQAVPVGGRRGLVLALRRTARMALSVAPGLAAGQAAAALLLGVVPVVTAWLTKSVVDTLADGASGSGLLLRLVLGLAAAGMVAGLVPQWQSYLQQELGRRVEVWTHDGLYRAINRLRGLRRFEDPAYQDRLRLAEQGGRRAPGELVATGLDNGASGITVVGFIGSLALLSVPITLLVLLTAIPALVAQLRLSRARAAMYVTITPMERRQIFFAELLTTVRAATESKLLGSGNWLRRRTVQELRSANRERRRLDLREVRTQAALATLTAIVAGVGLVWVVLAVGRGDLTLGDIAVYLAAVAGVQSGLKAIADGITTSHEALLLFGHYLAVIEDGADLPAPHPPVRPPRLRTGIEFDNVWFRYSDDHPWTLRGVSFTIPAGGACALVGVNGSGKTTLVKLLCRLYDPQRGAIRWDGIDLRHLDLAALRERLGVLLQEFMQYDLTARENIAIGDLRALDDQPRVEAAARLAGVHEKVASLPRGYDTALTRIFTSMSDQQDPATGVVLSGGQWQRLALARTLLRTGSDLVVLDEPSAGLDAAAELEIHTRLREHRTGRTSLLISHRLNTVRDADLIVVLDRGQVIEQGSHDQLVAAGGTYARLFGMQANGYQDNPREWRDVDLVISGDGLGGGSVVGAPPVRGGGRGGPQHAPHTEPW